MALRVLKGSHARDAGFSLLEVLVAALIAGLALGVLFQAAARSIQIVRVAASVQEATALARSRLEVLQALPLVAGEQAGNDGGGYRWRTRVTSLEQAGRFALFGLDVVVLWDRDGGERQVVLQSRRVGPAPIPQP